MLENKETTVKSYRKMLNQNTKNSPWIKFAIFLTVMERWEWIILAARMAQFLYFISIL